MERALLAEATVHNKWIEFLAIKASFEITCVTDTSFKIVSATTSVAKLKNRAPSYIIGLLSTSPSLSLCPGSVLQFDSQAYRHQFGGKGWPTMMMVGYRVFVPILVSLRMCNMKNHSQRNVYASNLMIQTFNTRAHFHC